MKSIKYHIIITLLLLTGHLNAQVNLPSDPPEFGRVMDSLILATGKEGASVTATRFQQAWSKLNGTSQDLTIQTTRAMLSKGYRINPQVELFINTLADGVIIKGMDQSQAETFLEVTGNVVRDYDGRSLNQFFRASQQFFNAGLLQSDKTYRLYASGSEFKFEYDGDPATLALLEAETWDDDPVDDDGLWGNDNMEDDDWDDWNDDPWGEEEWKDEPEDTPTELYLPPVPGKALKGPVISFEKTNLTFATRYDSVSLTNTAGRFSILERVFAGEGGQFNWGLAGLDPSKVYALLGTYDFDTRVPRIQAEQANIHHADMLDHPTLGYFEFSSVYHDSLKSPVYPRFTSYQGNIRVRNIGHEGMIYRGGFSLKGAQFQGRSTMEETSTIEVFDRSTKKFIVRAPRFYFADSTVRSDRASIVILQGNDSIAHHTVRFRYDMNNKHLTLIQHDGIYRNTPYFSTFFNMDFTADMIRWDLDSDSLDISIMTARHRLPAIFASRDLFDERDYKRLSGINNFNPLTMVVHFARKSYTDIFGLSDLVSYYNNRFDRQTLSASMGFLHQNNLIEYDPLSATIRVLPKGFHMVDAAREEKDFDNIIFKSIIENQPNATVNFKERYMKVRGIEGFVLNKSHDVRVVPKNGEITLLQNRDFNFDGTVYSGNFEYIGRNFTFDYNNYLINLNQIDSIRFYVKDEDSRGSRNSRVDNALMGVDSLTAAQAGVSGLGDTKGTLYIDRENNKSGKESLPNYPRFDSQSSSVVYFDKENVLNGAYDRSMFFLIPPYEMDSLDNSDPATIGYEGRFVSSGMFPIFEERLKIQPDFSLGFEHSIPENGYRLYEGNGRLYNKLTLNKKGLRGNGRIDFLSTSLESDDFIFYPDSVTGIGNYAEIKQEEHQGILFPQATLTNYTMKWLPKKDSLYLSNTDEPFQFYNGSASLDGTATISNHGVYGSGLLVTRGSIAESDQLSFRHDQYSARHAEFSVPSDIEGKPILSGSDVRVNFDLGRNQALVSPEIQGAAAIEFPYAQFKTSITEARWDLDLQTITMTKPDYVPIEKSVFYTTREDLDSLYFNASEGVYDIKTRQLKVSGIPYITVADAKITPENNEVLILENSRIGQLKNTVIVLDTLNEYHRIFDGVVTIISRNEFIGYGTYEFINAVKDTFNIKLENFRLEEFEASARKKGAKELHTVADGRIAEKDRVLLSPGMYYRGDVKMYAHKPALELDGLVKLDLKKIPNYDTWIRYKSGGEQKEIVFDFDNSLTEEGRRLEAGLHFTGLENELYSTFVTPKRGLDDDDFFRPGGNLYYRQRTGDYVIESPTRAAGTTFSGKVYTYNENTSDIRFEGPVKFFPDSKDFSILAGVLGNGNLERNEFYMNALLAIDMNIPSPIIDLIGTSLPEAVEYLGLKSGFGDPTDLLYKLGEIIGERATKDYDERSLQGFMPLAGFTRELSRPLVFSNVNLYWSNEEQAFYSQGALGLSNTGRHNVNAALEGFMEIKRTLEGGLTFNVFFKASPNSWYYFGLQDNTLLIYSSDEDLNSYVTNRTNMGKAKIGELVYAPGDRTEVLEFITKFRAKYYNVHDEYFLDAPANIIEIERIGEDPLPDLDDDGFGDEDDDDGF